MLRDTETPTPSGAVPVSQNLPELIAA